MSPPKAVPSTPCIQSRPSQARMTLIAIVFIVLFNCVNYSSTSPVSSTTKQESSNSANKETPTAEEDLPQFGPHWQPVKRAASRQYNFGIGKRNEDSTGLSKEDELLGALKVLSQWSEIAQNEKRANPQRFSFGLGKRAMEMDGQEESVDGEKEVNSEWQAPEKKKAERYNFGIGRRSSRASWYEPLRVPASHKKASNFEDFMKRRYSFGLGKRSV